MKPGPRPWLLLSLSLAMVAALFLDGCSGRKSGGEAQGEVGTRPAPGEDEALRAAFDAYEAGRTQEAIQGLLGLKQQGSTRAEMFSLLGLAHIKAGELEKAEGVLREGRNRHPRDRELGITLSELFFQKGRRLAEGGDLDAARREFQRSLAEVSGGEGPGAKIEAYYRELVLGVLETEDYRTAWRLLEDHRSLGLSSTDADVLRWVILKATGRPREAAVLAAAIDPSKARSREAIALWTEFGGAPVATAEAAVRTGPARACGDLLDAGQAAQALHCAQVKLPAIRDPGEADRLLEVAFRAAMELKSFDQALALADRRLANGHDRVQARLDQSEARSARGDVVEAKDLLQTLRVEHPGDVRVHLELAKFEARHGDAAVAQDHLIRVLNEYTLDPAREALIYELLGIVAAKRSDLEGAESWWLRLVGVAPDNCKAHYNLGTMYGQQGRYRESVDHLEKAIDCSNVGDPEYPKYLYWLALGYRQNGQNTEMCRTLEKITSLTPYKDPYHKRALEMRRKSGFCKVEETVAGLPESADHPVTQGYALLEAGNLRGAEEAFRRYLKQASHSAPRGETHLAWLGLGRTARRQERPARAVIAFERALALEEGPVARVELAEALFDLGLFERALATWTRLGRRSGVPQARRRYEMARCLDRLGRVEDAMAAYEEAISLDPDSLYAAPARQRVEELVPSIVDPTRTPAGGGAERAEGLARLAEAYLEEGDQAKASELFGKAFELGGGSPVVLVRYGQMQLQQGDSAAAEQSFRRAVETAPRDGAACLALAELVLARPEGLQEGFRLLMAAREAGSESAYRATKRMIEAYRDVNQEADARFLLEELAAATDAPPDLREWARRELQPDLGAAPGEPSLGGG